MAYKQKGFTPFTQKEEYKIGYLTPKHKEYAEATGWKKAFMNNPNVIGGTAPLAGGPIKGLKAIKALKNSPRVQRAIKAWSDQASKAFKAWKKGPGKKMWKKAQDIPTVSSSEFPKGYYKHQGKMFKGTYPKGTEVKYGKDLIEGKFYSNKHLVDPVKVTKGGSKRLKWDQHTMKFKKK